MNSNIKLNTIKYVLSAKTTQISINYIELFSEIQCKML